MANPKYTVTYYMMKEDGETVPLESLTEQERQKFEENARKRLESWGNRYFGQHPELYDTL